MLQGDGLELALAVDERRLDAVQEGAVAEVVAPLGEGAEGGRQRPLEDVRLSDEGRDAHAPEVRLLEGPPSALEARGDREGPGPAQEVPVLPVRLSPHAGHRAPPYPTPQDAGKALIDAEADDDGGVAGRPVHDAAQGPPHQVDLVELPLAFADAARVVPVTHADGDLAPERLPGKLLVPLDPDLAHPGPGPRSGAKLHVDAGGRGVRPRHLHPRPRISSPGQPVGRDTHEPRPLLLAVTPVPRARVQVGQEARPLVRELAGKLHPRRRGLAAVTRRLGLRQTHRDGVDHQSGVLSDDHRHGHPIGGHVEIDIVVHPNVGEAGVTEDSAQAHDVPLQDHGTEGRVLRARHAGQEVEGPLQPHEAARAPGGNVLLQRRRLQRHPRGEGPAEGGHLRLGIHEEQGGAVVRGLRDDGRERRRCEDERAHQEADDISTHDGPSERSARSMRSPRR